MSVSGCRVPRRQACARLAVELLRSRSPRGVPTVGIAIPDAGIRGENLPDVHNALRGVADHRPGNKVEAGIGKESSNADGIWRRRLGCRAGHLSPR